MMKNIEYLLALNRVFGLGPIRLKLITDYFQDPKAAWEAKRSEWEAIKVPRNALESWQKLRTELNPEQLYQQILDRGIKIMTIFDPAYPEALKEIYDPPVVIYYLGEIPKGVGMAVVGTRKISGYGRLVTEKFTSSLASAGLIIVSGLARGVDTVAHQSAIKSAAKTIAVLGGGLENIFPPENQRLAQEISQNFGAVMTEFGPEEPSLPGNFPARNRIIAGLSKAVLITEAAQDSGSLITAREALEQGKEVFAIPGPITSATSLGTAQLIKQGAKLVTDPSEILEELNIKAISRQPSAVSLENLSENERKILGLLELENRHIDQICQELKMAANLVAASLVKMEIHGLIKNMGGGNYLKVI